MDVNVLRETVQRQPFPPFTLRLVDRRELFVPHPDYIAIGSRRVVVINHQADATSMLEPLLILSIEEPSVAPPPDSQHNGPAT